MKGKKKKRAERKKYLDIDESLILPANSENISPTFCVAMLKNGTTIRLEGKLESFMPAIKKSSLAWVNVQADNLEEEGIKIASKLGFKPSIVQELLSQRFSGYDDHTTELGLLIPAVRVREFEVEVNKLIVLMRNNVIATIHGRNVTRLVKFARYAENFFKRIPKNSSSIDKISLVLIRIIDENNERNFDGIRVIEEQGEDISKYLINPEFPTKNLGGDIYKMKHALISYLEALWATMNIVYYLRYGDADLVTDNPAILRKVIILSTDLTTQISISEQMSTVLASGLEVLQSIYNNQLTVLNNRLASVAVWIAILGTAFVVPNTIATIFGTPIAAHLDWRAQLLIIVVSTVASVIFAYWFVKQKGFLPPKVD